MKATYEKTKIKQGFSYVIGCDEVGRGCLAGPVVAAAAILPHFERRPVYKLIRDSKLLNQQQRQKIEPLIKQTALAWGIGVVEREVIDEINIHNASLLAMKKAIEDLGGGISPAEAIILIDGKFKIPDLGIEQQPIIDGDAKILSIAAASIIAKVYRDNLMKKFDKQFPGYSFSQHKGYATVKHRAAIKKFGLTPLHRLTFVGSIYKDQA